ncbi:MAG: choice-of-anchor Q domain-containing protein, partial [Ferruginibacter sp.]
KMRTSDSTIVAGTHGRGLWTAKIPPTTSIAPTVTINQAAAQPDPTTVSPINFTVVFDQAVTGFATGDVTLSGTAGATTGTVTGSGTTYNVEVSGMVTSGTVIATIPAGVCVNGANEPNVASTSTDNTVTFTLCVTNPIVTNNANAGAGSLRQAVIDACPGSTITFNMATVTSPITLTTGEISILKNLTIQGPGAALLTINGGGSGRIFYVAGAGVTGNINALTLTGGTGAGAVNTGRGGAAYNNLANMNLTNMVITGNTAANGGGINTAGAGSITTITNSTISNNTSTSSGGGLQNFSTSTTHVIGSTISGNTSTGSFGGAFQANGTTTFANSTISGNSASTSGGGLYFNGPSATIINSTITNNTTTGVGGGINKIGTNPLNIRNTLIAGNNGGATAPDVSGTIVSQGFNLVGRVDGSTGFTQPTDLTGTIAAPLNPLLGTLANNGGRTQTHALLTGSPAIDKGSAANYPVSTLPILTDQRDSIRPYDYPAIPDAAGGNGSDIGAYELKDVIGCTPPTMNPVPSDTVCHNAIHPAINFTSSTPGTTFSWTNNNASIGLGASGTGNIAAFTATNPGAAPVVATITVTPSIGGGSSIPTPELFYYDFDGTGTSVPNLASAPPAGTATATIVGGQTQGTAGMCGAGSLV